MRYNEFVGLVWGTPFFFAAPPDLWHIRAFIKTCSKGAIAKPESISSFKEFDKKM